MNTVLILGTLGALLLVAPWLAYPPLMTLFRRRDFHGTDTDEMPSVTVLIPAHNEAAVIEAKLANTLELVYPPEALRIIVCSDGSVDGTDELVNRLGHASVTLLRNERRSGKATTVNRLVAASGDELILLTDASAMLEPDALKRLVAAMSDPRVGVAAARYAVKGGAEKGYWDFEARIRRTESQRDMLLGASGAAVLVRRSLVPTLAADTINDDYLIALAARVAGQRVAYVHDAVAYDEPTREWSTIYHRWVRISFGNYQMISRQRRLLLAEPRIALPFHRKLLRTISPWSLLMTGFGLTALLATHPVGSGVAIAGWTVLSLVALLALRQPDLLSRNHLTRIVGLAVLSQLAYAVGTFRFLAGTGKGIWRRAPENEVQATPPAPADQR